MPHILKTLINASEQAACVARSCCVDSMAETLLIAEKGDTEANTRFNKDFKTIADVLAQESAKAVIVSDFPELCDNVRGEESSIINGVSVGLQNSDDKTAELLRRLIPSETATQMAKAAHCSVNTDSSCELPENLPILDVDDLGIWIDPIDGTAEFIAGVQGDENSKTRLLNVTVLIGAYRKSTGEPVIGVINQPFFNNGQGRIVWGLNYNDTSMWNDIGLEPTADKIMLLSGAEKPDIIKQFLDSGWQIKSVAGAGNKLMKVALGEARAYIVSQGTTFRWDTCAPHAILKAKGGDVLGFTDFVSITYNDPKNLDSIKYSNEGGIIAYIDEFCFNEINSILAENH